MSNSASEARVLELSDDELSERIPRPMIMENLEEVHTWAKANWFVNAHGISYRTTLLENCCGPLIAKRYVWWAPARTIK